MAAVMAARLRMAYSHAGYSQQYVILQAPTDSIAQTELFHMNSWYFFSKCVFSQLWFGFVEVTMRVLMAECTVHAPR